MKVSSSILNQQVHVNVSCQMHLNCSYFNHDTISGDVKRVTLEFVHKVLRHNRMDMFVALGKYTVNYYCIL